MSNPFPKNTLSVEDERRLVNEGDLETLVLYNMAEAIPYVKHFLRGLAEDGLAISVAGSALMRAAKPFRPDKGRFFAYAKPFLRGAAYAEWRSLNIVKHSKVDHLPGDVTEDAEFMQAAGTESIDMDSVHFKDLWHKFAPLMEKVLTPGEREVLELHYVKNLSFADIGRLKKHSRSAPQDAHTRALVKLRKAMHDSQISGA